MNSTRVIGPSLAGAFIGIAFVGVAGVYTFEIAETKVQKTVQLARSNEYPLQLSIEPSE